VVYANTWAAAPSFLLLHILALLRRLKMCLSIPLSDSQWLCESRTSWPRGSTDKVFGGSFHCSLWKQET